MVLWKDEQNWQVFKQTHQERKREDQKKDKIRKKRRNQNWYHRIKKGCQILLLKTICQKIQKTGWKGQISRIIESSKTESRSSKPEYTNNS